MSSTFAVVEAEALAFPRPWLARGGRCVEVKAHGGQGSHSVIIKDRGWLWLACMNCLASFEMSQAKTCCTLHGVITT